jgi:A/G-specific adenine glycosylase
VRAWARALLAWFAVAARDLPWRHTLDPYSVHLSEIMLQQTQVKTVIPYWERWLQSLPTVGHLAGAPPDRLIKLWEGLGYYTRVRNLQRAACVIQAEHGGVFPQAYEAILALPGIGRYTAGAIASIAFNKPYPVLDGNVSRVLARLLALRVDPRTVSEELWTVAARLVATAGRLPAGAAGREQKGMVFSGNCSRLNQSLMELGALVCTPHHPQCGVCPLAGSCAARALGCAAELPVRDRKTTLTRRFFFGLLLVCEDKYWVRERPAGQVNAGFWEFPNIEALDGELPTNGLFGFPARELDRVGQVRHSITRYQNTVTFYRAAVSQVVPGLGGRWCTLSELSQLPVATAHRKMLAQLRESGI